MYKEQLKELAESIRKDNGLKQTRESMLDVDSNACCALGNAVISVKGVKWLSNQLDTAPSGADLAIKLYPVLMRVTKMPGELEERLWLYQIIIVLNDCLSWTFEEIAQWLETLEESDLNG